MARRKQSKRKRNPAGNITRQIDGIIDAVADEAMDLEMKSEDGMLTPLEKQRYRLFVELDKALSRASQIANGLGI